MSIIEKDGRSFSDLSAKEIEEGLAADIASLSPAEKEAFDIMLREMTSGAPKGSKSLLQSIKDLEYKHEPVDIETFLFDPYYLGETCSGIYKPYIKDLKELFSGGYTQCVGTGSIGIGKCAKLDTELFDTQIGCRRTVADIGSFETVTMDDNGKFKTSKASAFKSGIKDCVKITLNGGQHLSVSKDHKIFTARGWVEAQHINLDDLIATPRSIPEPNQYLEIEDDELKLISYLAADGGCTTGQSVFTNADPIVLDEFCEIASSVSSRQVFTKNVQNKGCVKKCQTKSKATNVYTYGLTALVRKHGIDCLAKVKRVPANFYGLNPRQMALFVNRFWACDGHICKNINALELTLASEGLIDDVRFMLLRLGILSYKSFNPKSYKKNGVRKFFDAWTLHVTGIDNILKFFEIIGPIYGEKTERSLDIIERCRKIKTNTNRDIVPISRPEIIECMNDADFHGKKERHKRYCPSDQYYGREKFRVFCEDIGYEGKYKWLGTSDLLWEHVKKIEEDGFHEVYDLSVPETKNFVANLVVIHNTFFSSVGILRVLYEISCLKDPHRSFGLAPGTDISIVGFSVTEELAISVIFDNVATKLIASQYFKDHFPAKIKKKEITFPNNVKIVAKASTDTSALGMNVIAAVLDEASFLNRGKSRKLVDPKFGGKDKAQTIYDTITKRIKSRYSKKGKVPGIFFIASSKGSSNSFTSKLIRESKTSTDIYVYDYPLWSMKRDQYSEETFFVLCGSGSVQSKIVPDEEVEKIRNNLDFYEGAILVEVPMDFKKDFEKDLDSSIRDIAGIETVAVTPFIRRVDKILYATELTSKVHPDYRHPFSSEIYDQSQGMGTFRWDLMVRQYQDSYYSGNTVKPIRYPMSPRHIHIDLSLRNDCTGIAMACIAGYKDVERKTEDNQVIYEKVPIYFVDFMLRVTPPIGGEIDIGDLRRLVYDVIGHGYNVSLITMDQFNSADSLQTFQKKGIKAELLSVDRTTDPYENLRNALYEDRLLMYFYDPIMDELKHLERDYIRNKIDHPVNGEKDVADALSAVCHSLSQKKSSVPLPMLMTSSFSQDDDNWMEEQRHYLAAGQKPQGNIYLTDYITQQNHQSDMNAAYQGQSTNPSPSQFFGIY